jgi:GDP-4-dehydro-6-deoxy-D-mannose reductase
LVEYLLTRDNLTVVALRRSNSLKNLEHLLDKITLVDGDLTDFYSLREAIRQVRPDVVFHLAAQSFVPTSFRAPAQSINVNALGTLALLEAIKDSGITPVIHLCGSSEVYGQVPENELPITESTELRPQSPYAVSKLAQEFIGYQYYVSYGMPIIRSRAFTQSGPRCRESTVMSAFARQIAEIELGVQSSAIIRVGNLDSIRTFCDVRDIVRAYWLLVQNCKYGEVYNIVGNEVYTIRQMLEHLLHLSPVKAEIRIDPNLLRVSDVTRQVANGTKFERTTGWSPEIPFQTTLQDVLNYWRNEISAQLQRFAIAQQMLDQPGTDAGTLNSKPDEGGDSCRH